MRFQRIDNDPEFPNDGKKCWWWDTNRLLPSSIQPYIAVQCKCDKDPNQFVYIKGLRLLFTDQAEYYAVCGECYYWNKEEQWTGSTQDPNWRETSQAYLEKHQQEKGWCEFCDPIFGNGGWV